jgi:hypothetical protein
VVGPNGVLMGGQDGSGNLPSPTAIANLAAWYDVSGRNSLWVDSSNRVQLVGDKSGNSGSGSLAAGAGFLALDGLVGTQASFTALTAFGTGDFTLSSELSCPAPSNQQVFIGSATNGVVVGSSVGNSYLRVGQSGVSWNNASSYVIPTNTKFTFHYVRSSGVGYWYINGAFVDSVVDTTDYTAGLKWIGTDGTAGSVACAANIYKSKAYTAALSASEVLADYQGTQQANCAINADFTTLLPGQSTLTESANGATVTLNGTAKCGWLDEENCLVLPGVAGNYASTPDAAALRITGDIGIMVHGSMVSWNTGAYQTLVARLNNVTNDRSFWLDLNTTGKLQLNTTSDGTIGTLAQTASTVATSITALAEKWVFATLDVDNGASGHDVKFYLSDDGVTWAQLGTTVTTAGVISIFAGTSPLEIGSIVAGTSQRTAGNFKRVKIYNGYDFAGSVVFDEDFSLEAKLATSVTASTGQTVTINSTAIALPSRITGARDLYMGTQASQPLYFNERADGLVFDGTYGAGVTNIPAFGTGDFTISAVVNQAASKTAVITDATAESALFRIIADGAVRWYETGVQKLAVSGVMDYGNDIALTLTRTGGTTTLYKNGLSVGSAAYAATDCANGITSIGHGSAGSTFEVINGSLRPLIYNRALSAAEVLALYNAGGVPEAGEDGPNAVELVTNGDFTSATGWNLGSAHWSIGSGVATVAISGDNGGATALQRNDLTTVTIGRTYRATYTLAGITSGGVTIRFGNTSGTTRTADGTYTEDLVATATDANLYFLQTLNIGATVDNASIVQLGLLLSPWTSNPAVGLTWYDTSGNNATITLPATGVTWDGTASPAGLLFDGSDDWMSSPLFSRPLPQNMYLVTEQITWTADDAFISGYTSAAVVGQYVSGSTPDVWSYNGNIDISLSSFTLKTVGVLAAVDTASGTGSSLRYNRETADTGNAGTQTPSGVVLASLNGTSRFSNITASEILIYDTVAHSTAQQDRLALYLGRKQRIAV